MGSEGKERELGRVVRTQAQKVRLVWQVKQQGWDLLSNREVEGF